MSHHHKRRHQRQEKRHYVPANLETDHVSRHLSARQKAALRGKRLQTIEPNPGPSGGPFASELRLFFRQDFLWPSEHEANFAAFVQRLVNCGYACTVFEEDAFLDVVVAWGRRSWRCRVALSFQTLRSVHGVGWLRDLTAEGVEPNPGPPKRAETKDADPVLEIAYDQCTKSPCAEDGEHYHPAERKKTRQPKKPGYEQRNAGRLRLSLPELTLCMQATPECFTTRPHFHVPTHLGKEVIITPEDLLAYFDARPHDTVVTMSMLQSKFGLKAAAVKSLLGPLLSEGRIKKAEFAGNTCYIAAQFYEEDDEKSEEEKEDDAGDVPSSSDDSDSSDDTAPSSPRAAAKSPAPPSKPSNDNAAPSAPPSAPPAPQKPATSVTVPPSGEAIELCVSPRRFFGFRFHGSRFLSDVCLVFATAIIAAALYQELAPILSHCRFDAFAGLSKRHFTCVPPKTTPPFEQPWEGVFFDPSTDAPPFTPPPDPGHDDEDFTYEPEDRRRDESPYNCTCEEALQFLRYYASEGYYEYPPEYLIWCPGRACPIPPRPADPEPEPFSFQDYYYTWEAFCYRNITWICFGMWFTLLYCFVLLPRIHSFCTRLPPDCFSEGELNEESDCPAGTSPRYVYYHVSTDSLMYENRYHRLPFFRKFYHVLAPIDRPSYTFELLWGVFFNGYVLVECATLSAVYAIGVPHDVETAMRVSLRLLFLGIYFYEEVPKYRTAHAGFGFNYIPRALLPTDADTEFSVDNYRGFSRDNGAKRGIDWLTDYGYNRAQKVPVHLGAVRTLFQSKNVVSMAPLRYDGTPIETIANQIRGALHDSKLITDAVVLTNTTNFILNRLIVQQLATRAVLGHTLHRAQNPQPPTFPKLATPHMAPSGVESSGRAV